MHSCLAAVHTEGNAAATGEAPHDHAPTPDRATCSCCYLRLARIPAERARYDQWRGCLVNKSDWLRYWREILEGWCTLRVRGMSWSANRYQCWYRSRNGSLGDGLCQWGRFDCYESLSLVPGSFILEEVLNKLRPTSAGGEGYTGCSMGLPVSNSLSSRDSSILIKC